MNKRLAIARAEIQEWQRGQRDLAADLEDKPVGYLAARSNKRLITDIYSRHASLRASSWLVLS